MTMRVTWTFRLRHYGWSETLYTPGTGTYQETMRSAQRYAIARLRLCGIGVEIPAIRVSDANIQGDALPSSIKYYTRPDVLRTSGVLVPLDHPELGSDLPDTSLKVSLVSAELVVGRIFMRGLPDEYFSGANDFNPDDAWKTRFTEWGSLIIAENFGPLARPKGTKADYFQITTLTAVKGQPLQLTAPGLVMPPTARLSITSAKFEDGSTLSATLRGGFTTELGTFVTNYIPKRTGVYLANSGRARAVIPFVPTSTEVRYGDWTTRTTGRPFGSRVGRRKRQLAFR